MFFLKFLFDSKFVAKLIKPKIDFPISHSNVWLCLMFVQRRALSLQHKLNQLEKESTKLETKQRETP